MDSVTQIVLGAAVGEAILGKKIGNRAILWGSIIGTLPDLDVLLSPFQTDFESMMTHRGLSHSFLFFLILSPFLGWLVSKIYKNRWGTVWDWTKFSFWVLVTHAILDSFTSWGTVLFYPFFDNRIALNNIFVADPLYTLPFLFCLIMVMTRNRETRWRQIWNRAGLIISSVYMLFTLVNKASVNKVFQHTFRAQGKSVYRFSTYPAPLNNLLWYGIGEGRNKFYLGYYSIFDSNTHIKFVEIPKNHDLMDLPKDDEFYRCMRWLSKDYFALQKVGDTLLWHDLRFGLNSFYPDPSSQPVFSYELIKVEGKYSDLKQRDPAIQNEDEAFDQLFSRIKGKPKPAN